MLNLLDLYGGVEISHLMSVEELLGTPGDYVALDPAAVSGPFFVEMYRWYHGWGLV